MPCINCGFPLNPTDTVCAYCGAVVPTAAPPVITPTTATPPAPAPAAAAAPANQPAAPAAEPSLFTLIYNRVRTRAQRQQPQQQGNANAQPATQGTGLISRTISTFGLIVIAVLIVVSFYGVTRHDMFLTMVPYVVIPFCVPLNFSFFRGLRWLWTLGYGGLCLILLVFVR